MTPASITRIVRNLLLLIILGAVLSAAVLSFRKAVSHPFHLDEAEEALCGLKMSEIGPRAFLKVPEGNMDVTHPLLYTFTHAAVQSIFGPSEFPLRMYGVFHFLLSLTLLLLIVYEITSSWEVHFRHLAAISAGLLYIVNPLLIQHSVVINADNNILASAILLFIYFFLRFERLTGKGFLYSRLKLALLFALCIWSKEMAPLMLIAGVLFYRILCRSFKRFVLDLVITGVIGILIFWLTWWMYCVSTGTDVMGFIKFTMINKSKLAFSSRYTSGIFSMFFYGMRWNIYWVSAPFLMATGIFFLVRLKSIFHPDKFHPVDFIFITASAIWLPFQAFRPTIDMVKYQYPSYPLFIAVLAWMFVRFLTRSGKIKIQEFLSLRNTAVFTAVFFILLLHYYFLGDYLLALWKPLSQHLNSHFIFYYYAPLFMVLSAAAFISKKNDLAANLAVWLIILIVPINAALGLNQAKADYLTFEIWLNYGESGLAKTIEYLKNNVPDGAVISTRADLEYYLVHRYGIKIPLNIKPEKIFQAPDDILRAFFAESPVEYLVIDKISIMLAFNPLVPELLNRYFGLQQQFGDFFIYKRKG